MNRHDVNPKCTDPFVIIYVNASPSRCRRMTTAPMQAPDRRPMPRILRCLVLLLVRTRIRRMARAQLTIEIVGGGATTIPVAIVPVRRGRHVSAQRDADRGQRPCAQRLVQAGRRGRRHSPARARRGRPLRRLDVARCGRGRRRQHDAAARWPDRGALFPARCGEAIAARRIHVRGRADADPGDRASDRRRHLRKAHRRSSASSARASPISPSRARATSCSSPRPTASIPQSIVTSNEPLLSPVWSPDGTRIAYVSLENKKPVVYVQSLASGQPAGGREFPRQQQRARVVARQLAGWRSRCPRTARRNCI